MYLISNQKISFLVFLIFFWQALPAQKQTIVVTGKIADGKGNPVIAVINVKDDQAGSSSDSVGVFTIRVHPDAILQISAIGYQDTALSVDNQTNFNIVLLPHVKGFNGRIPHSNTNPWNWPVESIIYSMPLAPHDNTKGSLFLISHFSYGIIVDENNKIIKDSSIMLDYDKMNDRLLIAQDSLEYFELGNKKVLAFAIKTGDSAYVFLHLPLLSDTGYFLLLAQGSKYSAYKSFRTIYEASNYKSDGMVTSGHQDNEYIDDQSYYWVDQIHNKAGGFTLKKKSIGKAFSFEMAKTEEFLSKFRNNDINDEFIKQLIGYLND